MIKRYAVHNLHCAGCAARIEDAIAGLPGVRSVGINLDSARMRVEGEQPELAGWRTVSNPAPPFPNSTKTSRSPNPTPSRSLPCSAQSPSCGSPPPCSPSACSSRNASTRS